MKTNKAKLAFDILEKEMQTIPLETQHIILGGSTGGSWGYVNGEYVYVYNGGTIEEVVINAGGGTGGYGSGFGASEVIGRMLTSMGTAATHAEINAVIAKLENTRGFSLASKFFGIAGATMNAKSWFDDPNWQDAGQVGLGLVALGTGGWIALGAGAALSAWELYEIYQESSTGGSTGGGTGGSTGGY